MLKKKQFNVRKIIFNLKREDDSNITVEITGKLVERKILFFRWYQVIAANPEKIVAEWGRVGFIKVDTRDFLNVDQIKSISYRTTTHTIEK